MRIALAISLALLLLPTAWCQAQIGGAQSLYVQPSARSAGMGGCTIAVLDDASASSWNPGGLAFMQGDISLTGAYSQLLPDWEDVSYWYGAAGVRVADFLVLATSVTYLSYGEQHMTTPDDPEPFETFEPHELIPSAAVAVAIGKNVGVGLNLKHVKVKPGHPFWPDSPSSDEREEGTTFATDIGVEYRAGFDIGDGNLLFRAGGAMQHLGEDVDYDYVEEDVNVPLPKNIKFGASGQLSYREAGHVLLCAQYGKPTVEGVDDDKSWILGLGGELQVSFVGLIAGMNGREATTRDILTGRIGWVDNEDGEVEGMSYGFGVGVEVDDKVLLSLDFAKVPQPEGLTEPWYIGGSGWFAF